MKKLERSPIPAPTSENSPFGERQAESHEVLLPTLV